MTHYAAIWVFGNYFTKEKPATHELIYIVLAGIFFLVVSAYLVMVFYDIPVRRFLAKKNGKYESSSLTKLDNNR
ncbi:hypothetical protein AHMF7616_01131 [Adhaeribacter pallidiroseus]|uniref:Uncharacterized protein n=1 Tax=Adhaeribacter pallidiroseus TaxID=2072847 RepID=A0A369QGZ8_9BACT|nr:hypothetical protein [Adhaeribacter pallidiroseus]RDC62537.1 hypothetical protein AHMF7616_01131 [Adhaeribacter pallidiroseus]